MWSFKLPSEPLLGQLPVEVEQAGYLWCDPRVAYSFQKALIKIIILPGVGGDGGEKRMANPAWKLARNIPLVNYCKCCYSRKESHRALEDVGGVYIKGGGELKEMGGCEGTRKTERVIRLERGQKIHNSVFVWEREKNHILNLGKQIFGIIHLIYLLTAFFCLFLRHGLTCSLTWLQPCYVAQTDHKLPSFPPANWTLGPWTCATSLDFLVGFLSLCVC